MATLALTKYRVTYKKINMKNMINNLYKTITFFTLISISNMMYAQTVVDITSNNTLPSDYNETGLYYEKDIHNYLDGFTGTWEYTKGSEKFQIILTKIVKYHLVDDELNLSIYKDGIAISYKKYVNGNLIFTSPIITEPTFRTYDGQKLEGYMADYGRVTIDVYWPSSLPLSKQGLFKQGGEYFHPTCIIEKMPLIPNQPERIKFKLYLGKPSAYGIGNEYNNPAYNGLPTFSIPNMVVMKKVP